MPNHKKIYSKNNFPHYPCTISAPKSPILPPQPPQPITMNIGMTYEAQLR